jgi:gluconate 2-dehydrogenase gamma chain
LSSSNPSRREVLLSALGASAASVRISCSTLTASALFAAAGKSLAETRELEISTINILNPDEAADMAAIAARIIPSDDTPGATEAGAIYFIDYVLGSSRSELLPLVKAGLAAIKSRSVELFSQPDFSRLAPMQQDFLLHEAEDTEFFAIARYLTVCGTFSLPIYGGNRDMTGNKLVGFDHRHVWSPPFGYYDADYMAKGE